MISDKLLEHVTHIFNICSRYGYVVAILTGVYLFMPSQFLDVIGVTEIANNHRPVIGTLFLLSVTLTVSRGVECMCKWIRDYRRDGEVLKWLPTLAEEEMQILRFYMVNQTRVNVLYIEDSFVQSLVAKGFILGPNPLPVSGFRPKCPYVIVDRVWQHLNRKAQWKAVLTGSTDSVRTDKDKDPFRDFE